MRHLAVLTVALLLVFAGCNGAPGGGATAVESTTASEATDATPTGTEATSSGSDANPDEAERPPGLSADGVADAEALADAHADALQNTSYAVVSNLTARDEGVDRARQNVTTRVVRDPTRSLQRSAVAGEDPASMGLYPSDVEAWSDENGTWYAVDDENGTTYRRAGDGLDPATGDRTGRDQLYVLFAATETTTSERTTENGTMLYRVTATGGGDDLLAGALHADAVENVSASMLVDPDGLVHRYEVSYDATVGNATARVDRTVRFTALGETSVERPPWYDEAVNATAGE